MKCSLDSKLQIDNICSIRIPSRNRDIIEKPVQLNYTEIILNIKTENVEEFILYKFGQYFMLKFSPN